MDYFSSMDAFVRVAEVGNFTEVARQLNVSKSVVTARIQQFEEFVGAPLFHRTTRSVTVSEVGKLYYEECAQLVAKANEVVDQMRNFRDLPAGLLRIHGLPGLVLGHMAGFLKSFRDKYPGIKFDFVVSDSVIDPVREGFDCTVQIFDAISQDLIQKKLFPIYRVFCASPEYLGRNEPVLHPLALQKHALGLYSRYPTRHKWIFDAGNEQVELDLSPQFNSNSVHFLKELAVEGAAVVCIPTIVAAEEILAGRLVPLLRGYRLPTYFVSAVYPKTQRNSIKLKIFLDELTKEFSDLTAWDNELIQKGYLPALVQKNLLP